MSALADPLVESIEHLDFHHEPPCEFPEHPECHVPTEAAAYLIAVKCPACGQSAERLICPSGWDLFGGRRVVHRTTSGGVCWRGPREEIMRILRRVGGAP